MALTHAQRTRFARHILLPELGEAGQARLVAATVRGAEGDAGSAAVARDYLERAGVRVVDTGQANSAVADTTHALASLAGRGELMEAARALAGAFAAVETIKGLLALGTPSELPSSFSLASEEA